MKKIEIKETKLSNTLNVVSRWIVGLVFLFSSFVKGVDPMGTMFKVEDYMTSWELFGSSFEWALPLAGFLAVALICAEFLVGVMLITNAFRVLSAWLLSAMMLFFTCSTFYDAMTDLVKDCGCFGDAIKLSNWETFWKNVVLDVFTVVIFLTRNHRKQRRMERDLIVVVLALVAMVVFCVYNIKHEPVIDFRPWKVGNKVVTEQEELNVIRYVNKQTGEPQELRYKTGEWDTAWNAYSRDTMTWRYDTMWHVPPFEVKADGFSMMDHENADHAVEMLTSEEGTLIITVYDLDAVDEQAAADMRKAVDMAMEKGFSAVVLSSDPDRIPGWLIDHSMTDVEYYLTDATAIKTILRGNPGYLFVRGGVVVDKGREMGELKIEN
jgi:uncharacterized membrane protein YphA (DoxX/SURF4 family)